MRTARAATIYDELRFSAGHDGAIKSPSPQSEVPIIASSWYAAMDSSAVGEASTTVPRSSDRYAGGDVTPQTYVTAQPMNVDDNLADTGMVMNARAANPSRGLTPNPRSPLARRA